MPSAFGTVDYLGRYLGTQGSYGIGRLFTLPPPRAFSPTAESIASIPPTPWPGAVEGAWAGFEAREVLLPVKKTRSSEWQALPS